MVAFDLNVPSSSTEDDPHAVPLTPSRPAVHPNTPVRTSVVCEEPVKKTRRFTPHVDSGGRRASATRATVMQKPDAGRSVRAAFERRAGRAATDQPQRGIRGTFVSKNRRTVGQMPIDEDDEPGHRGSSGSVQNMSKFKARMDRESMMALNAGPRTFLALQKERNAATMKAVSRAMTAPGLDAESDPDRATPPGAGEDDEDKPTRTARFEEAEEPPDGPRGSDAGLGARRARGSIRIRKAGVDSRDTAGRPSILSAAVERAREQKAEQEALAHFGLVGVRPRARAGTDEDEPGGLARLSVLPSQVATGPLLQRSEWQASELSSCKSPRLAKLRRLTLQRARIGTEAMLQKFGQYLSVVQHSQDDSLIEEGDESESTDEDDSLPSLPRGSSKEAKPKEGSKRGSVFAGRRPSVYESFARQCARKSRLSVAPLSVAPAPPDVELPDAQKVAMDVAEAVDSCKADAERMLLNLKTPLHKHTLRPKSMQVKGQQKEEKQQSKKPIIPEHVRRSEAWTSIDIKNHVFDQFEVHAAKLFQEREEVLVGSEVLLVNPAILAMCRLIRELGIFERFSDMQLRILLQVMHLVRMEKDEWVMRVGDIGREFFVILDGEVNIFPNEALPPVTSLKAGTTFGEQALLEDARRNASIRCKDAVVMGKFHKESALPNLRQIELAEAQRICTLLQTIPPFSTFSPHVLLCFAAQFRAVRLREDTYILKDGAVQAVPGWTPGKGVAAYLGLVSSGSLQMTATITVQTCERFPTSRLTKLETTKTHVRTHPLKTLKAGDYFGHAQVYRQLDEAPGADMTNNFSVYAETQAEVLLVPAEEFARFVRGPALEFFRELVLREAMAETYSRLRTTLLRQERWAAFCRAFLNSGGQNILTTSKPVEVEEPASVEHKTLVYESYARRCDRDRLRLVRAAEQVVRRPRSDLRGRFGFAMDELPLIDPSREPSPIPAPLSARIAERTSGPPPSP